MCLSIWGADKVKVLFRELSEIYFSCYNLYLQFLHIEKKINNLETVVSVLSCGALERSNSPYIESIVAPCVSKNFRNKSSLCGFDWQENSEKGLRQWKKVCMS